MGERSTFFTAVGTLAGVLVGCASEPTPADGGGSTATSVADPTTGTEPDPTTSVSGTTAATASLDDDTSDGGPPPDSSGDDTTSAESSSTGQPNAGPFPDLPLGPYPSLLTMATDSMLANAESLNTATTYAHSAGQGYLLQAIGELLWAARAHELEQRDALLETALAEIAELEEAADQILGGGPGYGLAEAWDAFGDGSTNPAYTGYTWQSGMVALGVAKIARVLVEAEHPQAQSVLDFGVELVERWDDSYTEVADGGYWWYSTQPSDAIAVHNTSGLVAMASMLLADVGGPISLGERPPANADLLWARMTGNPTDGYSWNYADDGYPVALRRPEDVSHALVTLQVMADARARDWWSNSQAQGVAQTLLTRMWSGHPARLHGRVDGSSGGDSEWSWSRAATIGYAAHGDTQGGNPAVFEYGRSLLFSSYLSRYERDFESGTVDAARTLALALMLGRRPEGSTAGSPLEVVAGDPDDDATPRRANGTRFYNVDWAAPADLQRGLTLPARIATAPNANFVVDVDSDYDGPVVVSVTYAAAASGSIDQWDGTAYQPLASAPATLDDEGTQRWMRTTFVSRPDSAFDHQADVAGLNLLFRLTTDAIAVHRIEATPL